MITPRRTSSGPRYVVRCLRKAREPHGCSQPTLPTEEAEHASERDDERGQDDPEGGLRCLAWIDDVHPEDARQQRQRQHRHADDREQPQDVVLAVRDDRLVRRLERLDDLLVVVELVQMRSTASLMSSK